jgi:hypothetical protein
MCKSFIFKYIYYRYNSHILNNNPLTTPSLATCPKRIYILLPGLKLWLSKGSFRPQRSQGQALRVPDKNFFLLLDIFSGKNFLPETLTLPLPLAQSVSKPKLSHSLKLYLMSLHQKYFLWIMRFFKTSLYL